MNDGPRFDLLEEEQERELQRKASLEQRGVTVITASGALVTIVFGFASLVTKGTPFANFSTPEKVFLVIALAMFVLASYFGASANFPRAMGQLRTANKAPDEDPDRYYSEPVWEAFKTGRNSELLAEEISDAIQTTKNSNKVRAQVISIAMFLQSVAILSIGIAVILIVFYPPRP